VAIKSSDLLELGAGAKPQFAMVGPGQWKAVAATLGLTSGELDVLQAIFRGDGEKQAAVELDIARRALHARLERIHKRLGVHSRTELILKVLGAIDFASEAEAAHTRAAQEPG